MAKKNPSFVHLHVHTDYSMLDGVNRVSDLIKKVKDSGMSAVALTDHGVMHGLYEFWNGCLANDIKPIIGCEIFVSPAEMTIREEVDGIRYYHLILLAKNLVGYKNLLKIVSKGHLEGFYYRPRVDKETLEKYKDGLICTSACAASPTNKHLIRGEYKKAEDWLKFLHATYKDDFYLELQRHHGKATDDITEREEWMDDETFEFTKQLGKVNKQLIQWSSEYDIPLIATTDAHYLNDDDEFTQEVLFCIKDGVSLDSESRRKAYKGTYIKTPEEMYLTFSDIPEVLENTVKLANKIEHYDIKCGLVQPNYPDLPKNKTSKELLKELCYKGAKVKYREITQELEKRLQYELDVINDKGYNDYFLVVGDIMKWARSRGIVVGARGSAGGSVVAYCMDIVNTDPISWGLYFERFLNPERESLPDIDLDIQDSRRDEVLEYVSKKYGENNVCGVGAIGRLKTRAAIRDVCRVLDIDLSTADTLSKMVEVVFGKTKSLDWMLENNHEFRTLVESDPRLQRMASVVRKIEGMSRHISKHACGYLVTPTPSYDYVPVQTETGASAHVITQIEGWILEELGLMKFDFLGLSNLSIIEEALKLIKKIKGIDIDIYNIPYDDNETFKIFKDGNTTSVFQFESDGMKKYLRELQPDTLDDLCFMAAAYRPGPMKFITPYIECKKGIREPEYLIPELKPILENTYGFAIYQEQVIRIAVEIAGYTMGTADILRRAMGKKKVHIMKAEKPKFIKGVKSLGYDDEIAKSIWDYLLPFADYGFNKSHSAAYCMIGYWTAYLKVHYPMEFMAARLTSDMEKPDKLVVALNEARQMDIDLLSPDINLSDIEFVPEGENSIRFGLTGIKNVGYAVVEEIIQQRRESGDYKSLDDFIKRVPSANSRTIEALIKVGAFKKFGEYNVLLEVLPEILKAQSKAKRISKDQLGLFANKKETPIAKTPLPSVKAAEISEVLTWEKELLGIYFTAHPIQNALNSIEVEVNQLGNKDMSEGMKVSGIALIKNIKQISTKKGDLMAFVSLEDMYGEYDSVLFPSNYKKFKDVVNEGDVVYVVGKCNLRNGDISIIVDNLKLLKNLEKSEIVSMGANNESIEKINYITNNATENVKEIATIYVKEEAGTNELEQLRQVLLKNPGQIGVTIRIKRGDKHKKFKFKRGVDSKALAFDIADLVFVEKIE